MTEAATKPKEKLPFSRLGRYEVRAKIAEGGMAMVYLGRANQDGKQVVALKVIRREYSRDMNFVAMFLDEAKLVGRLSHPNIVKIHEQSSQDGHLFIAMELLFGQSLATVWEMSQKRGVKLPFEVVAWIGARVADALQHAHELKDENGVPQEVVHRDINPSNVFITYGGQVKIIDFGLAKAVDRLTSTVAGIVKGKLAYMSPEQLTGKGVDRRADIFSLGTTLWELTVNKRLFKCERDVETLQKVQAAVVPNPTTLVKGYPPELARVILHALAKEREARYQTAGELAKELDHYVMAGGRIIGPATLLEIMTSLFPTERDRDASWFEETGLPFRTVPLEPVRLSADDLMSEAAAPLPAASARTSGEVRRVSGPSVEAAGPGEVATATEPSVSGAAGVPKRSGIALSSGEITMLAMLAMLVLVAVWVAVSTLTE